MLAVQKIRRMPFSSRTRMRRIFVCVLSRHPPRHNQRICARSWGSGSQYAMQASLQASAKAIISAGPSGTDSPLMIPHYENVLSLLRLQINPAFKRYVAPLASMHVGTTKQMVHAFSQCQLKDVRGLGKKFFGLVREFIHDQADYVNKYKELYGGTSDEVKQ